MKHFDEIFELAADGYGIVTAAQAREIGVTTGELSRWCATGKLMRRGHGVYKLTQWVPTPCDVFAEAVALVGDEGFLWGESVLSMHALALVDPRAVTVATPKRVRRKLPAWVKTVSAPENAKTTFYEGIPSQCVADAIEACKGSVMTERLIEATKHAQAEGLITSNEHERLMKELS
ncbi:MAG: type IV toxin-antitoxin system AbiEi family antitoxin domain-containing protein [Collinsella aerofaciens]